MPRLAPTPVRLVSFLALTAGSSLLFACSDNGDTSGGGAGGGVSANGGASASAGGSAQGGASGGTTGSGGTNASGGATGNGGTSANGGAPGTGGATTNGGASTGGANGSGGASTGGSAAKGGATNSGGSSKGGAASGGSNQGGSTSAGAGTGGAAKGGAASGGASNGGTSANGGAASGGTTGGTGKGGSGGTFATPPALTTTVTVHVAGDSTAAVFPASDGRVGWASVLGQFFASGLVVNDAALSGRSTKSYIDEGAWTTLQAKIKTGDYLFIEFGHNDEKSDDPARYTDPATSYRTNLKTFIDGARSKGGYPVLLTSICRRYFSGTTVTGTHGAYTEAVFAVAAQNNVPVIDMESRTKVWLTGLGPVNSVPMFATDDNTHLSAQGAPEVAKLAVAGIRDLNFPIAARLK